MRGTTPDVQWAGSTRPGVAASAACCCHGQTVFIVLCWGFFRLFHAQAPSSILAFQLIAMGCRSAEAVKVAFFELFLVNDGRDDFPEARVAKGRADIVRPPGNSGRFFPLLAAFDTLNTQSVHAFPIASLAVDGVAYAVYVYRKPPI